MTHLEALSIRRFNEAARLMQAKDPREIALRKVWLAQIDKEIAQEIALNGRPETPCHDLTDEELFAELEKP
jgi:hypothetical protein